MVCHVARAGRGYDIGSIHAVPRAADTVSVTFSIFQNPVFSCNILSANKYVDARARGGRYITRGFRLDMHHPAASLQNPTFTKESEAGESQLLAPVHVAVRMADPHACARATYVSPRITPHSPPTDQCQLQMTGVHT